MVVIMVFIVGALEGDCLNACEHTIIITELFMQISKIHIKYGRYSGKDNYDDMVLLLWLLWWWWWINF